MFTNGIFQEVCLIAGIVLAVFSALLLMSFLLSSTEARKRDIGILRSLGASRRDTVGVCAAQSIMVAVLDFILAVICGAVACLVINNLQYNPVCAAAFAGAVSFPSLLRLHSACHHPACNQDSEEGTG